MDIGFDLDRRSILVGRLRGVLNCPSAGPFAGRLEERQSGPAPNTVETSNANHCAPREVAMFKSMSAMRAENSPLPSIGVIGRLLVGGFAGLMIWEIRARKEKESATNGKKREK
jgi:hypothetical protein